MNIKDLRQLLDSWAGDEEIVSLYEQEGFPPYINSIDFIISPVLFDGHQNPTHVEICSTIAWKKRNIFQFASTNTKCDPLHIVNVPINKHKMEGITKEEVAKFNDNNFSENVKIACHVCGSDISDVINKGY